MKDPIVQEVRRIRHEHEMLFGCDLNAIYEDIRRHQAASGRTFVRLPAKRMAVKKRTQRKTSGG